MFGQFGLNYKLYKEAPRHDSFDKFEEYFNDSVILEEKLYRALMYFNLPYESVVKKGMKPQKVYLGAWRRYSKNTVEHLIEKFQPVESERHQKYRRNLPNIILMFVESGKYD